MNEIIVTTVDSLLTDTSVKWTPRVGPCLSLLLLFDSLQDGHLSKMDTQCRSQRCPSQRELTVYYTSTLFPRFFLRRQVGEKRGNKVQGLFTQRNEDPSNRKIVEGDTIFCCVYMQTFWLVWLPSREGIKHGG